MRSTSNKDSSFVFSAHFRKLFPGVLILFFLVSGVSDTMAFQNSKRDRMLISKEKKRKTDSIKAQKVKKPVKVKAERKPLRLKLGKPELSGVLSAYRYLPDENTETNINFSAGLEVDFRLSPQLQVFTGVGVNYIDQNFKIGTERVQGRLNNGALLARELVSTDVLVIGLEIPIGVRYRLRNAPNSLVASFGFTTRTSIKERYEDHIIWKTGGLVGSNFVASTTRETSIINDSPESFEFLNVFSSGFLGLGKSFRVVGGRTAEIQITYHFNVAGVKNIFQEARFKKYESLGITLKYPLRFGKLFK